MRRVDDARPRSGSPRAAARRAIVVGIVALAWVGAYLVRFDAQIPAERFSQLLATLPLVILVQLAALHLSGTGRDSWRYTTLHDVVPLVGAVALTGGVLLLARLIAHPVALVQPSLDWLLIPFGVSMAYVGLAMLGLVGARVTRRLHSEYRESRGLPSESPRRVLLLGAGRAGSLVAQELAARPDLGMRAVGFADDDPVKRRTNIAGLPVLGTSHDLEELAERHRVDEIVISIASASGGAMRRLVERCEEAGFHPRIVPGVAEVLGGNVSLNWFRPVELEDLLGRAPVELEADEIARLLTGGVVLVTGAGGSIGAELARQVATFSPARLLLVERAEPSLWAVHRELERSHPDLELVPALADVTDAERVDALLAEHAPSVVLHAAAHKHVPLIESNPGEAVKNNVVGTRVLADLCAARDVERFVLISTDKAVNPSSVMGATKRLAERYVQHVAHRTGRAYVSVRFGNVLGSTGSVVPVFEEQIAAGGPVTVTHPEMRRYFMTIPEASQLVLQAAVLGRTGEILVLDMGEPTRIVDLAASMIRLSGYEPGEDIDITFTGLRPGEKLFEEIALTEEGAKRTRHPKVFIGRTPTPTWPAAGDDLGELVAHVERDDEPAVRGLLGRLVPEYDPSPAAAPASGADQAMTIEDAAPATVENRVER